MQLACWLGMRKLNLLAVHLGFWDMSNCKTYKSCLLGRRFNSYVCGPCTDHAQDKVNQL
jgi:hypothetical protein